MHETVPPRAHSSCTEDGPLNRMRLRSARGLGDSGHTRESLAVAGLVAARAGMLRSPRSVFFALREDDPDDVGSPPGAAPARHPVAGSRRCSRRRPPPICSTTRSTTRCCCDLDFIAGGLYGAAGYFVVGFALFFGARLLGSLGDFRRARQLVGFALVPLAASLLVIVPLGSRSTAATLPRGRLGRGCGGALSSGSSSRSGRGRSRSSRSACGSSTAGAGRGRSARSSPRSRC